MSDPQAPVGALPADLSEAEMREAVVPTPGTPEELSAYIAILTDRPHDYGTCVYAMSMAATATFNMIASKFGVTGFQASCADMDILRRTRGWKGPAMVLDLSDALYPQYDLIGRVRKALDDNAQWLADEARKLLADREGAHPNVVAHWRKLARAKPALDTQEAAEGGRVGGHG